MNSFLEAEDAAQYVGVPVAYLLNQAKKGDGSLAYYQPSPKKFLFSKADLDAWVKSWKRVAKSE
jgi:excisionase family DNA binding protein